MNFFSISSGKVYDPGHFHLSQSKDKKIGIDESREMSHRDVLFRILYIFGRTNKGIGYIQGMNELVSVIYFCFYINGNEEDRENIEADTFWCYFKLIAPVHKRIHLDKGKVHLRSVF